MCNYLSAEVVKLQL